MFEARPTPLRQYQITSANYVNLMTSSQFGNVKDRFVDPLDRNYLSSLPWLPSFDRPASLNIDRVSPLRDLLTKQESIRRFPEKPDPKSTWSLRRSKEPSPHEKEKELEAQTENKMNRCISMMDDWFGKPKTTCEKGSPECEMIDVTSDEEIPPVEEHQQQHKWLNCGRWTDEELEIASSLCRLDNLVPKPVQPIRSYQSEPNPNRPPSVIKFSFSPVKKTPPQPQQNVRDVQTKAIIDDIIKSQRHLARARTMRRLGQFSLDPTTFSDNRWKRVSQVAVPRW